MSQDPWLQDFFFLNWCWQVSHPKVDFPNWNFLCFGGILPFILYVSNNFIYIIFTGATGKSKMWACDRLWTCSWWDLSHLPWDNRSLREAHLHEDCENINYGYSTGGQNALAQSQGVGSCLSSTWTKEEYLLQRLGEWLCANTWMFPRTLDLKEFSMSRIFRLVRVLVKHVYQDSLNKELSQDSGCSSVRRILT